MKKKIAFAVVILLVLTIAFISGDKLDGKANKKDSIDTTNNGSMESVVFDKETFVSKEITTKESTFTATQTVEDTNTSTTTQTVEDVHPSTTTQTVEATKASLTQKETTTKEVETTTKDELVTKTNYTCTISISCKTLVGNDDISPVLKEYIPKDGYILEPTIVSFSEGETVFDVLCRICDSQNILIEYSMTPVYNTAYIEGIGNIYEFDGGKYSGWMYFVNDKKANVGVSASKLKNGDKIEFKYTCNLGNDL